MALPQPRRSDAHETRLLVQLLQRTHVSHGGNAPETRARTEGDKRLTLLPHLLSYVLFLLIPDAAGDDPHTGYFPGYVHLGRKIYLAIHPDPVLYRTVVQKLQIKKVKT